MNTSHLAFFPVLIPLLGAASGLLFRNRPRLQGWYSFVFMLVSLGFSSLLLYQVVTTGKPIVFEAGGWPVPAGIVMVGDILAATLVFMAQLVITGGFLYALGAKDSLIRYPTFFPLFLTLTTGLSGAFLTGDLFNLFVFIELLVISGTILTAISDDRNGVEAAYKYFYISLLAAMFLLLAIGALYVSYGTVNMADLAEQIAKNPNQPLLPAAVGLLAALFMIKSAVFPFHFWQPDFHTASPTPVHAVLSSVVVKLGIYGFYRMNTLLFPGYADTIQTVLLVTGVIGVFYGGLAAMGTYDVKRMLAYSTMGQIGFILVGLGWGTPVALAAALIFAFNHSLIKAAMLMLAGAMASRAPIKSAAFSVVTGLGKKAPFAGVLFFIGGLALAGVPPTNGFISKWLLFESGVQNDGYLALGLLGIGGVITLVYTNRAFQRIWWHAAPASSTDSKTETLTQAPKKGDLLIAPGILILLVLGLGLFPNILVRLALQVTSWLGSPALYIQAVLGG